MKDIKLAIGITVGVCLGLGKLLWSDGGLRPGENIPRPFKVAEIAVYRDALPWRGSRPCSVESLDLAESYRGTGQGRRTGVSRNVPHPLGLQDIRSVQAYPLEDGGEIWLTDTVVRNYVVRGATLGEALRAMDQRAKRSPWGDLGLIEWYLDVDVSEEAAQTAKQAADAMRLRLTQIVLLPEWAQYLDATPQEQSAWDAIHCHILHHERAHMLINISAFTDYAVDMPKHDFWLGYDLAKQMGRLDRVMAARNEHYHVFVHNPDYPERGEQPLELSGFEMPERRPVP